MFLGWGKLVKPPEFWYGKLFRSVTWEAEDGNGKKRLMWVMGRQVMNIGCGLQYVGMISKRKCYYWILLVSFWCWLHITLHMSFKSFIKLLCLVCSFIWNLSKFLYFRSLQEVKESDVHVVPVWICLIIFCHNNL